MLVRPGEWPDIGDVSPLLRPGSFVFIDDRFTDVEPGEWKNELERPISLVEFRNG